MSLPKLQSLTTIMMDHRILGRIRGQMTSQLKHQYLINQNQLQNLLLEATMDQPILLNLIARPRSLLPTRTMGPPKHQTSQNKLPNLLLVEIRMMMIIPLQYPHLETLAHNHPPHFPLQKSLQPLLVPLDQSSLAPTVSLKILRPTL